MYIKTIIIAFLYLYTAVFFYMLGNIQPMLRSSLKCIQLIACITTPLLQKYGYHVVLKPFIRDVNRLPEVHITYKFDHVR